MSRGALDRLLSGPVLFAAGLLALGIAALGHSVPQTQPFVGVSMLATGGFLALAIGILGITRPQVLLDVALRAKHSIVFDPPWDLRFFRISGVLLVFIGLLECWGAVAMFLQWARPK
jgi:hypothetical protein